MLGRSQLDQQLLAREALRLQRLQALDVAAHALAPHAAVHDPDPVSLAVAVFDAIQEAAQGRAVGRAPFMTS